MDKMVVKGGNQLKGQVKTGGAKNAALPLLFSSLLAKGTHRFYNIPHLNDIHSTCTLLIHLGCECHLENHTLTIKVPEKLSLEAPYDIVRKMRASILCLGPLLARMGETKVSLPGGCAIGTRPINLHLEGLGVIGAQLDVENGYVIGKAHNKLQGDTILFENPSVGATENVLMAASLAEGKTIIENAAKEPEILDLANYLITMGAKIKGAGTGVIEIEGVSKLIAGEHSVIPDRIEAGTLILAGVITGGEVTVTDCQPQTLEALLYKLKEAGVEIRTTEDSVMAKAPNSWRAVDMSTAPYPAFPTDLQAQFMAFMTQAEGTSLISETVFENRFMHVQELMRLNADITPKTTVAVVRGAKGQLKGAPVMATDLRASASLVLAGLVAEGETVVSRIYHLDRGYESLESKLKSLGAEIKRVSE